MALFQSTKNQIADIVPSERCIAGFATDDDRDVDELLRRLLALAGLRLDYHVTVPIDRWSRLVTVAFRGREETIRFSPPSWYFPPSALMAYVNAKLAESGSERELVACHDGVVEVVALCEPHEADELRACIFVVDDGLRWPSAHVDETEAGLLAAIRATPADDGPRLVYADWLIERGDPRGHFIALQCHPEHEVRSKANALLRIHEPAWTAHLPAFLRDPWFDRGFVQQVSVTREVAIARRADLLALTPVPDLMVDGSFVQLDALV